MTQESRIEWFQSLPVATCSDCLISNLHWIFEKSTNLKRKIQKFESSCDKFAMEQLFRMKTSRKMKHLMLPTIAILLVHPIDWYNRFQHISVKIFLPIQTTARQKYQSLRHCISQEKWEKCSARMSKASAENKWNKIVEVFGEFFLVFFTLRNAETPFFF